MQSQFTSAELTADGSIRLQGEIGQCPDGTRARLRVTVTQDHGAVAEVAQVVTAPHFDVLASRTSWAKFEADPPGAHVAGLLVAETGTPNKTFQWLEDHDLTSLA